LESLPGIGKVRARTMLDELGISPSRRIKGLGVRQREGLLKRIK
jgi:ribosomal protein S13